MNAFANLSTSEEIQGEKDTVGGNGPLDSDVYGAKVTMAYVTKSTRGALGVVLHLKTTAGREHRETIYVTSGDDKGNKNYFEKDGEKKYLPGFINMNALCLLTVGKELSEVDTEEKVVKVYDFEQKKEVPMNKEVLVELLNEEIKVGLQKQIVDKRAKQDDGSYGPTGETREVNEIDKFFRASDDMTTAEIRAAAEEADFINVWTNKWKGQVRDRSTKDAQQGRTGAPAGLGAGKAASPFGANKSAGGGKSMFK